MSYNHDIKPALNGLPDAVQAYRDACSEADAMLAENQRLTAELAVARQHAKVLAKYAFDYYDNEPDEALEAALSWAKEQP